MEITPEIRAAVLAAECAAQGGHLFDISQLMTPESDGHTMAVRAREGDTIPHLFCRRCAWVWLIGADGPSYDAAEDNLNAQVLPKHRRKLRRERRRDRLAAEAAEAQRIADEAAATSLQPGQPLAPVDTTSAPTPAPTPAP
jgi:hypothetical protein